MCSIVAARSLQCGLNPREERLLRAARALLPHVHHSEARAALNCMHSSGAPSAVRTCTPRSPSAGVAPRRDVPRATSPVPSRPVKQPQASCSSRVQPACCMSRPGEWRTSRTSSSPARSSRRSQAHDMVLYSSYFSPRLRDAPRDATCLDHALHAIPLWQLCALNAVRLRAADVAA